VPDYSNQVQLYLTLARRRILRTPEFDLGVRSSNILRCGYTSFAEFVSRPHRRSTPTRTCTHKFVCGCPVSGYSSAAPARFLRDTRASVSGARDTKLEVARNGQSGTYASCG
jgi:hypothetical protein